VDAFFQPAFTALVPQLVPAADLPSANSLASMSIQFGRIIGPAVAGGMIALGGTALGFAANALSFFVSAVCLIPLFGVATARAVQQPTSGGATRLLKEAQEGVQVVVANPVLWISILVFTVTTVTLMGPYSIALPFLVEGKLAGDIHLLGMLYALFAVGYVFGGVWLGRKTAIRRRGLLLYGGGLLAGLGMLLLGLPLPLLALGLAALLNGAALEVAGQVWMSLLQELVPAEKLGRVASIDMIGSLALLPLGIGAAGWLTDVWGPAAVIVLGGGLTMLATGVALLHPAIRRLD
jgi:MFS family permease